MLIHTTRTDSDGVAAALSRCATLARSMPPSWDGAKIAIPCTGPDGEYFGKALPGRGLYLAFDRKFLGLTKLPPFVYEPSPIQRLMDQAKRLQPRLLGGWLGLKCFYDPRTGSIVDLERGAISTYDDIIAARAAGTGAPLDVVITKNSDTTVATAWHNLFQIAGIPPAGAYSALGSGTAPDNTFTGSYSFGLGAPTSPNKKYLLTFGFTSVNQINMAILFDLLSQDGGILMSNATNTVNTAALTRYTGGAGVLAIFEVTTALGATAGTIQLASYTNQAGTAARANAATTCVNSAIVHRLVGGAGSGTATVGAPACVLQGTDFGIRAVATVTSAGNTGGGVVAINLYFPLAFLPGVAASIWIERDSTVQIDGLVELAQTSGNVLGCLGLYVLPNTTTIGQLTGFIRTCEG